jgi:methylated-DNA-[protein]-cysteine S-methyltransferase
MSHHLMMTGFGMIGFNIEAGSVVAIDFDPKSPIEDAESNLSLSVKKALSAYLSGETKTIDVPFDIIGTAFEKKVLNAMRLIPYGETVSYQELGRRVGLENGSRAIGNACAANPLPLIFPCHRVVRKNGGLGGFSGGADIKRSLLRLENPYYESSFRRHMK